MWRFHSDRAGETAEFWKIVDVDVLDPIEHIDTDGATALHVNAKVGPHALGRVIVPCSGSVCSSERLRIHLHPFVPAALTRTLRDQIGSRASSESPQVPEQVSVIVCTRRRPEQLDRCLSSLAALVGVDAEIIVVDNDDVRQANGQLTTFDVAARHAVTYVREPVAGLDRARNRGVATATREILLFTDDDVEVDPHWARHLAAAFHDPVVAAATGLVTPAELASIEQIEFEMLAGFIRTYDDFVLDGATLSPAAAGRAGAGASMAFRREFLQSIGGFPEVLDAGRATTSGGDTFGLYAALHAGRRIRFEPRAVVHHYHRSETGDGAITVEGYARGVVSYLLHAALSRRDLSAFVAALRWTTWRVGVLSREWLIDPSSRSSEYLRRQVRGALSAPKALTRAVLDNSAPPVAIHPATEPASPTPRPSPVENFDPSVSVVIPTAGRRPGLIDLIAALHQQTHAVEIIVSADGDFADRDDVERAVGAPIDARVVVGSKHGAGDARNRGSAVAHGRILLFLDDDVQPIDDEFVARHAHAHRRGHRAVVGPVVGAPAPGSSSGLSLAERNWWSDQARRIADGGALDFTDVCSGNLSIDRALFAAVGGFRTLIRREDFELGIRLIENGVTVIGLSDASVWHMEMCSVNDTIDRRFREGQADCVLADIHPASVLRLGLGQWQTLSRRQRPFARFAISHPRVAMFALRGAHAIDRTLDAVGSRRRLHRLHTFVGQFAYWAGVGRRTGGIDEWNELLDNVGVATTNGPRSTLDLDQPHEWAPLRSGSHLVDVVRGDVSVGIADMRWGGVPFDRDQFAAACATRFSTASALPTPQPA